MKIRDKSTKQLLRNTEHAGGQGNSVRKADLSSEKTAQPQDSITISGQDKKSEKAVEKKEPDKKKELAEAKNDNIKEKHTSSSKKSEKKNKSGKAGKKNEKKPASKEESPVDTGQGSIGPGELVADSASVKIGMIPRTLAILETNMVMKSYDNQENYVDNYKKPVENILNRKYTPSQSPPAGNKEDGNTGVPKNPGQGTTPGGTTTPGEEIKPGDDPPENSIPDTGNVPDDTVPDDESSQNKKTEAAIKARAIENDWSQARQIYIEMMMERQKWMAKMWETIRATQDEIMNIIQRTVKNRTEKADAMAAKWAATLGGYKTGYES